MQFLAIFSTVVTVAFTQNPSCGIGVIKPYLNAGVQTGNAITGGQEAIVHSWPWQAAICQNDWFSNCYFKCSATVIGERWLLAPASCYSGGDLAFWNARAGMYHESTHGDPGEQRIDIKALYPNPGYDASTKQNNFMLVETAEKFKFGDYVQPICLPLEDDDVLSSDKKGWIIGWGYQKDGGNLQNMLQQAQIYIDDTPTCGRIWSRTMNTASELCAGEGDKTLCSSFDEGVPLMIQSPNGTWFQHGSAAMVDKHCQLPGIFSRVSYFCNWVDAMTMGEVKCIKRSCSGKDNCD